jgi:type III restriction enzyme
MGLDKNFPKDKFAILHPSIRWFPADEDLRKEGYEKLLPPFVPKLREEVYAWRQNNYEGASGTSKNLLNWWFKEPHIIYDKNA